MTLKGHLKHVVGAGTVFSEFTASYLDVTDIMKILVLNKPIRATALKYNSNLFCNINSNRIYQLSSRIKEWTENSSTLRRQIGLMEAKEKARNQLLQNVTEQRIRTIIDKHVIKPILGHSQFH